MRSLKRRIARARWFQVAVGIFGAAYLKLVWWSLHLTVEPADIYQRAEPDLPVIVAMWHGQHYLAPFIKRPHDRGKVLISRHRDGEVNAVAAKLLGIEAVRGSGDHGVEFHRKGGVSAFIAMAAALADGYTMALTADVPKKSRVAGLGIIMLARSSGRPIYPVAIATRHRVELKTWDRSAINLPFGRCAFVIADPIRVPQDADDGALEQHRLALQSALDRITARAYAIVDRRKEGRCG
jgi:lysophospholipid acyltransferase (LPLAT)-like uncharacterized protein